LVNIMGFDFETAPLTTDANSLMGAYGTHLMPQLSSLLTLESVHILYQSDSAHQLVADSNASSVVGGKTSGATATMPPQVAWLLRKKTSFAGRSQRGRMYVPGMLEGNASATGSIASADLTAMQGAVANFFSAIAGFHPVLIHSVVCEAGETGHEGPHTGSPLPVSPLTTLEVDDVVATQRRRLRR
jgi:hypothetical protein